MLRRGKPLSSQDCSLRGGNCILQKRKQLRTFGRRKHDLHIPVMLQRKRQRHQAIHGAHNGKGFLIGVFVPDFQYLHIVHQFISLRGYGLFSQSGMMSPGK